MSVGTTTRVTPNGRDLLLVARAVVLGSPCEAIEGVLRGASAMTGVSPETMRLLEETLAHGGVRAIARRGGWRRQPRLTPEGARTGRLWEARTTSPLAFSSYTFELLRWLVTEPLGGRHVGPFRGTPRLPGDELIAYLTCALVERQPLERCIAEQPGVRRAALAWLAFPRMLAEAADANEPSAEDAGPRFAALASEGAVVLEGLSDDLARRAATFEREKQQVSSTPTVLRLGETRGRALGLLLDACEAVDRWDLATFMIDAAIQLPSGSASVRLDASASLRERSDARRASAAHWRCLGRLGRHHEELRQVRHFDDGYPEAQLLLSRWERFGSQGFSRAAEASAACEALDGGDSV